MFLNDATTKENIYNFVDKAENFKAKMQLLPVDFQKPWWAIILKQKKVLFIVATTQITWSVFDSLFPVILGYAILRLDQALFFGIILLRFILTWIYNSTFSRNAVFQIQTMGSVEYAANQYFLSVDPICHTTKSSGQIISKINRGSSAYETVLDIIAYDLLGIVTSMITVTVTMFAFSLRLGLVSAFFMALMLVFNITAQIYRTRIFQPKRIKAEDIFKAISLETLLQVPFIRATFASNEQTHKLQKNLRDAMVKEGNSWQSGTYVGFVTRTLHIFSILAIGLLVINQASSGAFEPILALSIILAYLNGTQQILYTGDKIKRLTTALSDIDDLFGFIRGFGTQSFPVLESDRLAQTKLKN